MFFNESKAREVTNYLLKNDIKIYRQFMPLINGFNSEQFEKLFNGIDNYDYKITMHYHFQLLIAKFNNYKNLLLEWYEDNENYVYLKQLWLKNISFESLINMKDIEIEQCLENKDIYINKWPKDKKDIFLQNLRDSRNTIYKRIKRFFSSIPEKLKRLLELINSLSKDLEKKGIGDIATNLLNYGSSIALIFANCPQLSTYRDICRDFITNLPSKISFKEGIEYIKQNLSNYKEILKSIYDKKGTKVLYAITSIYNLGSSIYNIYSINKLMKEIDNKDYENEIKKIEVDFRNDRKNIHADLNCCDISEYDKVLREGIEKIENHEKKLRNIIIGINEYIKEVEARKSSRISSLIGGIAQLGIGIVGGIVTGGVTSAFYFASSGLNAISVIINGVNIDKLKDLNKKLLSFKEKADSLHNEMINELYKLKALIKEDQEAAPIYF